MHRVHLTEQMPNQRVTGFMDRRNEFFLIADYPALTLGTGHHAVDRFFEMNHRDLRFVLAGGQYRTLV